ncbi:GNAT family protein [Pseudovibrio sp. Tun.PSC04-5.I4]|uniref:GNAT family N-acetyltransferase n=1 Tax=Pseudovibrio sp. Tun.PSC04-5.I4 TaxID=1798213 RepID=UPI000888D3DF|nr:GNAT family protein [Pseudovibrio sp. Tun.PSC04-5.I4]SDR22785.1 ribosomal-protein-alanine N-acetyltransferase [Pseudovibrio sp. Tun.PSC04-5.I4]
MLFPELKTSRLILRQARDTDLPRLVAYANTYEVASMLSGMPHPFTEEDGKFFINRAKTNKPKDVVLWVIDDGTGLVGTIWAKFDGPKCWTGYWLGKPHWGNGYMSEALQATLSYAFALRDVSLFSAGVFNDNPASYRLLEKMGFHRVGLETISSKGRGGAEIPHILLELPKDAFIAATKVLEGADL